jgi:hypothetical protein
MKVQQEQGMSAKGIDKEDVLGQEWFDIRNLFGILGFAFFLAWTISTLTNPYLFLSFNQ